MTIQMPLLLVDNVFDYVNLYPNASLLSSGDAVGHEVKYVADYRRERTWWQAPNDGTSNTPQGCWVGVDLGVGNADQPNMLFIDRGHNLWGKTINIEHSTDGVTWSNIQSETCPASGTVGTAFGGNGGATEEGALWVRFTNGATNTRFWRVRVAFTSTFVPVITGLILGVQTALSFFSKTRDEDAGDRLMSTQKSDAGYMAASRVYHGRTLSLDLGNIGSTVYDATIRMLRSTLFEVNEPVFVLMDWGTYPERGWLYVYDDSSWSFAMTRASRDGSIPLRELYPLIS